MRFVAYNGVEVQKGETLQLRDGRLADFNYYNGASDNLSVKMHDDDQNAMIDYRKFLGVKLMHKIEGVEA